MKIFCDRNRELNFVRIAGVAVVRDYDAARRCAFGNAGHQEIIGADKNRAFRLAKLHARALQSCGPKAAAEDAHFASRQGGARNHGFNMRLAVYVALAQDAVGNPHNLATTKFCPLSATGGSMTALASE